MAVNVVVDTNVALDYLMHRGDFYEPAHQLVSHSTWGDYRLMAMTSQVTDMFYLMTTGGAPDRFSREKAKRALIAFFQTVSLRSLTPTDVESALRADWKDFEDACLYEVAVRAGAKAIITRNKRDFAASNIPVYTCEEWFQHLKDDYGLEYAEFN